MVQQVGLVDDFFVRWLGRRLWRLAVKDAKKSRNDTKNKQSRRYARQNNIAARNFVAGYFKMVRMLIFFGLLMLVIIRIVRIHYVYGITWRADQTPWRLPCRSSMPARGRLFLLTEPIAKVSDTSADALGYVFEEVQVIVAQPLQQIFADDAVVGKAFGDR
jgi:hypothetical protein